MYKLNVIASVAAVAAVCLLAAGCESSATVSTTPVMSASVPVAAPAAKIGTALALTGLDSSLLVDLVRYDPQPLPANDMSNPETGKKLVAVQFTITNVDKSAVYDGSPGIDSVQLIDAAGASYTPTIPDKIQDGQSFGSVHLAKGEKATGWVVFEIPTSVQLVRAQFTLGESTGEWQL